MKFVISFANLTSITTYVVVVSEHIIVFYKVPLLMEFINFSANSSSSSILLNIKVHSSEFLFFFASE